MTKENVLNKIKSGYKYSRFCGKVYLHDNQNINITKKVSNSYRLLIERMVENGDLENVGTWIKIKN